MFRGRCARSQEWGVDFLLAWCVVRGRLCLQLPKFFFFFFNCKISEEGYGRFGKLSLWNLCKWNRKLLFFWAFVLCRYGQDSARHVNGDFVISCTKFVKYLHGLSRSWHLTMPSSYLFYSQFSALVGGRGRLEMY